MRSIKATTQDYINTINYLHNVVLEYQKVVCDGKYKIDCYIEKFHLAIEYDEKHHAYQTDEDKKRENEINEWFLENSDFEQDNIQFIRVNENNEDYFLELIMGYLTIEI